MRECTGGSLGKTDTHIQVGAICFCLIFYYRWEGNPNMRPLPILGVVVQDGWETVWCVKPS